MERSPIRSGLPRSLYAAGPDGVRSLGGFPAAKQAPEVSLRRIGGLLAPHWPRLAAVTGIIVASSLLGMATPFLLRGIIDRALPAQNLKLLVWLVAGLVAVAVFTAVFGLVQTGIATAVGQRVMHQLRVTGAAAASPPPAEPR